MAQGQSIQATATSAELDVEGTTILQGKYSGDSTECTIFSKLYQNSAIQPDCDQVCRYIKKTHSKKKTYGTMKLILS